MAKILTILLKHTALEIPENKIALFIRNFCSLWWSQEALPGVKRERYTGKEERNCRNYPDKLSPACQTNKHSSHKEHFFKRRNLEVSALEDNAELQKQPQVARSTRK